MKVFISIILLILIITDCAREYSCEGCYERPVADTTLNDLTVTCDVFVEDNSMLKNIFPQYTSSYHPATYLIFETIVPDTARSSIYRLKFNLKDHFRPNETYVKGDVFRFRIELRWRIPPSTFVCDTILVL